MKNGVAVFRAIALVFVVGMLLGCASKMMKPTEAIKASQEYAVVNFMRPSWLVGSIPFKLWDNNNFVGILTSRDCIQYKATPGEHIFIAYAFNWAAIKANAQAGKTYYVLASPRMSMMGLSDVSLEVLKPDDKRIDEWIKNLKLTTVDTAKWDAEWQKSENNPISQKLSNQHQDLIRKVQNESVKFSIMNPVDGR